MSFVNPIQGVDVFETTEDNMHPSDIASEEAALRSRRPQCTPRNFTHENREASEAPVVVVLRTVPEQETPEPRQRLRGERQDHG